LLHVIDRFLDLIYTAFILLAEFYALKLLFCHTFFCNLVKPSEMQRPLALTGITN